MKHVLMLDTGLSRKLRLMETAANLLTWTGLREVCVDQDNGGRIVNAKTMRPAAWAMMGTSMARVQKAIDGGSALFRWDGDDLLIGFFDAAVIKPDGVIQFMNSETRSGWRSVLFHSIAREIAFAPDGSAEPKRRAAAGRQAEPAALE